MSFDGTILALDVATKTGVCIGKPGGKPYLATLNFRQDPTDEPEDIYGRAVIWMATRLKVDPPALIVIEKPVPPSAAWGSTNHQTTLITIGLFGVFCGVARAKNIKVMPAPISTWRKYTLGKGNMKGALAKARAVDLCRQLGWEAPDHNAAEAACIFLWSCSMVAPQICRRVEPLFLQGAA